MRTLIFALLFIILLSINVSSFGVVSDFLEDDTIELIEGTSILYKIRLQNPTQADIRLKLTYDKTFIKVIDYQEEYTVRPKENLPILFNVTAGNAKQGKVFTVTYTVHQLAGSGSGVPILIKIAKGFKLKIIKDPHKFYISNLHVYAPQAIIVLLIISFLVFKKIGKNKSGNR